MLGVKVDARCGQYFVNPIGQRRKTVEFGHIRIARIGLLKQSYVKSDSESRNQCELISASGTVRYPECPCRWQGHSFLGGCMGYNVRIGGSRKPLNLETPHVHHQP